MVTPEERPLNAIQKMGQRVLQAAERLQDPYLESLTYLLLSFDPLQRGHLGIAGEWAQKLIDLGKHTGYPPAQSLGWVCSAWVAAFAEDHEKALVASELALSELTTRTWSDIEHYLDSATATLVENLRAAGDSDRPFRQSQLDAAVRFCRKVFGDDYAALLLKARDVAAGAERKAAKG